MILGASMVDANTANALITIATHYFLMGSAIVIAGFLLSVFAVRSLQVRLWCGAGMTVMPPLSVALLYYWGESTGCSGGDCTGVMIAIGMLMMIATVPTLFGFGIFLGGLAGGVRQLFGKAFASN